MSDPQQQATLRVEAFRGIAQVEATARDRGLAERQRLLDELENRAATESGPTLGARPSYQSTIRDTRA